MKSALVTGGTTRVGKVIAERLRADGWHVLTTSHRADAGADIVADFTESGGAVKAYAAAMRILGGAVPDALVNNAALFSGTAETLERVNLVAPRVLVRRVAAGETGRGAVVNIIDAQARDGVYARTKSALREYTRKAAEMFAGTLAVNAVSPGPVLASAAVHEPAGECPCGRPTAADVAAAVAFLLSSPRITGQDIVVDGGQHLL